MEGREAERERERIRGGIAVLLARDEARKCDDETDENAESEKSRASFVLNINLKRGREREKRGRK